MDQVTTTRRRIDLSQAYVVRDWANRFGVSKQELLEAIAAVGDDADLIHRFLAQPKTGDVVSLLPQDRHPGPAQSAA